MNNKRHPIYTAWSNMKARCLNSKHPKYYRYGGRGITICPEWLEFKNFFTWAIFSGWQPTLTLDRTNNDGNYCADNCRWVLLIINSGKKSTTKISSSELFKIKNRLNNGEDYKSLADEYHVNNGTIWFIKNDYRKIENAK